MAHTFLPDRPVDEARSLYEVEQGRLPLRAQRRIAEMNAMQRPIFTSTLSPSEMVVAKTVGLTPVSQVMGSSIFHVGFRGYAGWGGGELIPLTQAYERARLLALSRMEQEAMLLGAHAVLDVRFVGRGFDWGEDLIEYTAIGTAVRLEGAPPPQRPALTLLTTDEFVKVRHAGYWPVGIAMGNCFYYDRHADCMSEGAIYSSELTDHSEASRVTRGHAVSRFRASAHRFGADGVVGVRVHRVGWDREYEVNDTSHTSFHLDMMVWGTAVIRRGDAAPPPRPLLVVDLRDLSSRYGKHG